MLPGGVFPKYRMKHLAIMHSNELNRMQDESGLLCLLGAVRQHGYPNATGRVPSEPSSRVSRFPWPIPVPLPCRRLESSSTRVVPRLHQHTNPELRELASSTCPPPSISFFTDCLMASLRRKGWIMLGQTRSNVGFQAAGYATCVTFAWQ